MSWSHFEQMATEYASARPPYPTGIFEVLEREGVIGPGRRVLEVGAGAGLATGCLVASGSRVVALEPGRTLGSLLRQALPEVQVLASRLEDADLPAAEFDAAVAATSMHWVDLDVGLPTLHAALRPEGRLAVFRTIFGDPSVETDFRDRVGRIKAAAPMARPSSNEGPSMLELSATGHFEPLLSERWRWSLELTTDQVTRLFRTFSAWTDDEVRAAGAAADACGGLVTEHYQSVLHVLARA